MSVSTAEAAFVRDLVYRRSAIVLEERQLYLIETRLEPLAVEAGFKSIDALVSAARNGELALQSKVVEALTTNETFFFRDHTPFECLQRELLPRVLEARAHFRALTIWCAACSTGQEPYSIAMLLLEHFPMLATWNVRILATDLSEQTLARGRSGRYRQAEMNRGLPAPFLVKYFTRTGLEWELKPAVRRLVEFSQLNLSSPWSIAPRPDIVFLRNVLIYFDQTTKQAILRRVRDTMAKDGGMFLGAAETTLGVDDNWTRIAYDKTAYYRCK